jgi:hypothetical protein
MIIKPMETVMKPKRDNVPANQGALSGASLSSTPDSLPQTAKGKPRWLASQGRKSRYGSQDGGQGGGMGREAGIKGPWSASRKNRMPG